MITNEELKKEIDSIKERNRRVEADKAWETSLTRKMLILILTYIMVVLFFYTAGLPKPLLNALVPSLAFLLSTLTVSVIKRWWLNKVYK